MKHRISQLAQSGASDGDAIVWDGTLGEWVPGAASGGGGGAAVGAFVSRSTTQSFSNGTPAAVSFDTEVRDDGGCWTSGAATRLTVPTDQSGWYVIAGSVWMAGATGNGRRLFIRLNGTTEIAGSSVAAPGEHNDPRLNCSTPYYLTAADYVELIVDQNQGSAVNIQAGSGKFSMIRVA